MIYKLFIWPHLHYRYISYDHTFNNYFQKGLRSIEFNAVLAIIEKREKPQRKVISRTKV